MNNRRGIWPFKNISKRVVPLALLCAASQIKSTVTPNFLPLLISQLLLWYLAKKARQTFSLPLPERRQNHGFSIHKTVLSGAVLYLKWNRKDQAKFCCVYPKEIACLVIAEEVTIPPYCLYGLRIVVLFPLWNMASPTAKCYRYWLLW